MKQSVLLLFGLAVLALPGGALADDPGHRDPTPPQSRHAAMQAAPRSDEEQRAETRNFVDPRAHHVARPAARRDVFVEPQAPQPHRNPWRRAPIVIIRGGVVDDANDAN